MLSKIKKISRIFQFGGKGNTANVINVQTLVVNMMYEQIAEMKKNRDYNGIANLMIDLKKQIETNHPLYPHYRYNVQDTNLGLFVSHEPMSREAAERFPLEYNISFKLKATKNLKNKTPEELLHMAAIRNENIEIDNLSLETLIGGKKVDTPFLSEHLQNAEWILAPGDRPDPLKLMLEVTSQEGKSDTIIPYLELEVSDIDQETNCYVLDNSRQQGAKIYVKILVPRLPLHINERGMASLSTNLTLKINHEYEREIDANIRFLSFFKYCESGSVTFTNLNSNTYFLVAHKVQINGSFYGLEDKIRFLVRLQLLEKFFSVKFQIPLDKMTKDDQEGLEILESIRTNKPILKKANKINAEFEDIEGLENFLEFFKDNKSKGLQLTFSNSDGLSGVEVLGTFVSLPYLERKIIHDALVLKNRNRLKEVRNKLSDNEVIHIELIPTGNNQVQEWYTLPTGTSSFTRV